MSGLPCLKDNFHVILFRLKATIRLIHQKVSIGLEDEKQIIQGRSFFVFRLRFRVFLLLVLPCPKRTLVINILEGETSKCLQGREEVSRLDYA